jgi:glutathione reductase (NADPH)
MCVLACMLANLCHATPFQHCVVAVCLALCRYIAVEFAGIFQGLGAQVHLMYRADKPLRG